MINARADKDTGHPSTSFSLYISLLGLYITEEDTRKEEKEKEDESS